MDAQAKMKMFGCAVFMLAFLSCTGQKPKGKPVALLQDCTQIKADWPQTHSGVYPVQPACLEGPFKVYCEMQADGGWTVFQRRSGGNVTFDRNWADYKNGFGSLTEDHWLGLNQLFSITKSQTKTWILRVELWDHEGGAAFAQYADFWLGNERNAFKLHVGEFSGNAGDAIRGDGRGNDQNGFGFSTADLDNDGCSPCFFGVIGLHECASIRRGGWWFSRCGYANLNGDWHPAGDHIGWTSGLHWQTWKSPGSYSFKATRMMIKSVPLSYPEQQI